MNRVSIQWIQWQLINFKYFKIKILEYRWNCRNSAAKMRKGMRKRFLFLILLTTNKVRIFTVGYSLNIYTQLNIVRMVSVAMATGSCAMVEKASLEVATLRV